MAKDETVPLPELSDGPPSGPVNLTAPGPLPEPEAPPRRRRGPRRAKVVEPQPVAPTGPVVSPEDRARCALALSKTFGILSKIAAAKRGAHWLTTEEENATLGEVWTVALEPYLPKVGAAMPWAAALAVTAAMCLPRLDEDARIRDAVDKATQP